MRRGGALALAGGVRGPGHAPLPFLRRGGEGGRKQHVSRGFARRGQVRDVSTGRVRRAQPVLGAVRGKLKAFCVCKTNPRVRIARRRRSSLGASQFERRRGPGTRVPHAADGVGDLARPRAAGEPRGRDSGAPPADGVLLCVSLESRNAVSTTGRRASRLFPPPRLRTRARDAPLSVNPTRSRHVSGRMRAVELGMAASPSARPRKLLA